VRERFGRDAPLRLLLHSIVPDRARRRERFGHIARIKLVHQPGMVAPYARVAIGLQLHAHGDRVELRLRDASARLFQPLEAAGELLHVMPDLVRDHVGLGEIPGRAKARLQIAIKREVDVQLLVAGAVERAHR
jgi:hypothetical protein